MLKLGAKHATIMLNMNLLQELNLISFACQRHMNNLHIFTKNAAKIHWEYEMPNFGPKLEQKSYIYIQCDFFPKSDSHQFLLLKVLQQTKELQKYSTTKSWKTKMPTLVLKVGWKCSTTNMNFSHKVDNIIWHLRHEMS